MGNEQSENQLIGFLASQGRQNENIKMYEEAVKNDPDRERNWYLLVYSYGGNYGDGIDPEKNWKIVILCNKISINRGWFMSLFWYDIFV